MQLPQLSSHLWQKVEKNGDYSYSLDCWGSFSIFSIRKIGVPSILTVGTACYQGLMGCLTKKSKSPQQALASKSFFFFPFFGGEGGQGSFHRFSLRIFSGLTYQRSHHDSSAGCLLWGQGQDKREKTTHFSESLLQVWRSSQTTCFCLYLCPQVGTLCILSKIFSCQ